MNNLIQSYLRPVPFDVSEDRRISFLVFIFGNLCKPYEPNLHASICDNLFVILHAASVIFCVPTPESAAAHRNFILGIIFFFSLASTLSNVFGSHKIIAFPRFCYIPFVHCLWSGTFLFCLSLNQFSCFSTIFFFCFILCSLCGFRPLFLLRHDNALCDQNNDEARQDKILV